jgi:hypothetical protein
VDPNKVVQFPPAGSHQEHSRSHAARWKHADLFAFGFLSVPAVFLQHYATLKPYPLTTSEAMFVLQLMSFKWDAKAPFPSYRTLAARMGVTEKMARRYAKQIEEKGYLRRASRVGRTNAFDLNPLFDALLTAYKGALAVPVEEPVAI